MALTWSTFESALTGATTSSAALDALIDSSMADLQATLDTIGAGEAGPLLAEAQSASPSERASKLTVGLAIIDPHLTLGRAEIKRGIISETRIWSGQASHYSAIAQCALAATLIAAELGADPESLRHRAALATTAIEGYFAVQRNKLAKKDFYAESTAVRRTLSGVFKLIVSELKSRRAG